MLNRNYNSELESTKPKDKEIDYKYFIENIYSYNRIVMLNDEITMDSILLAHAKILDLRNKDPKEPIALYISSYGGEIAPALWLASEIEHSDTPIITICPTHALSAATLILMAGHLRVVFNHTIVLFHGMQIYLSGDIGQTEEQLNVHTKVKNYFVKFMAAHTKLSRKQLNDIVIKDKEFYLIGDEIIDYGIADEIFMGVSIVPEQKFMNRTLFVIPEEPKGSKKPKTSKKAKPNKIKEKIDKKIEEFKNDEKEKP